jgi:hypothetical protein
MLTGRLRKLPVNATPVPHGTYEYVAGPTGRPVLRELDGHELLAAPQGDRYVSHLRWCPPLSVDVPDDPADVRTRIAGGTR